MMNGKMKTEIECPKCNNNMDAMTACHLICPNCGSHLDCSDKGNFGNTTVKSIEGIIYHIHILLP